MRIAAFYDIHGNLPALEAVLVAARREGVDRIVVGGDVIPGPMPREALARLREVDLPVQFIKGNGEHDVLACLRGENIDRVPQQFQNVIRWTAEQLDVAELQMIASWPGTLQIGKPPLGEILFCHATPRSDIEIFTCHSPEDSLLSLFAGVAADIVVCGHTHMQFDRHIGGIRVVNAGSVGMPFGKPCAYWLLIDRDVELRHTSYDLVQAAERIRATSYPQAESFAAHNVLQPPGETEMLEVFGRADKSN